MSSKYLKGGLPEMALICQEHFDEDSLELLKDSTTTIFAYKSNKRSKKRKLSFEGE